VKFGNVKWFDPSKGYGFISPEEGGKDVFVHHSAVRDAGVNASLVEGQRVSFDVEQGPKGLNAVDVKAA